MGVFIAITIIFLWAGHLVYALANVEPDLTHPLFYIHVIIQGFLYTGLFITSHDSIHGTVSKNKNINIFIGYLSAFLFAAFSYKKLSKNHYKHHKYSGKEGDPDYCVKSQNFFYWLATFFWRYLTIVQIVLLAGIFNLLMIWFTEAAIFSFWVIPALLGTMQLFYFGVYYPHKQPHEDHMKPYNARTMKKNHLLAMLSCYFFGYHHEHHHMPYMPWWKLYKTKN